MEVLTWSHWVPSFPTQRPQRPALGGRLCYGRRERAFSRHGRSGSTVSSVFLDVLETVPSCG